MHFADAIIARSRHLEQPLCAGLDPHLPLIPPLFRQGDMLPADPRSAAAVAAFFAAALPRLAPHVAAVKPQSAFFERLGWRGIQVLEDLVTAARAAGLPVILDAKRGDIGSTAEAYAGYLDGTAPLQAEALTVNPYLGRETLQPFIAAAAAQGRGVFVLAKTSNPGAADFQDRRFDDAPLYVQVARALAEPSRHLRGESGWSSLGIVAGATHPRQHEELRACLPHALFLVPGYGAQGAPARDAVRGFVRGPRGLEGGVVSSSRALLFPAAGHTDDIRAWERALDDAIAHAVDELRAAVA